MPLRLIKPDKSRRITIPGVAAPVQRPVDIDQETTGFTTLRTLRIYCFEAGSVIEGHAEEDEVFIVLLSGSVELAIFEDLSRLTATPHSPEPVTLSAPSGERGVACAAYLPPHAAYKLTAKTGADVAYARATPSGTRPPKVFLASATAAIAGVSILLEATSYAERLRLRLVQVDARQNEAAFVPVNESEGMCEALIHIRTTPTSGVAKISQSGADPVLLDSWDTIPVSPGDRPTLQIAMQSSALALIVLAD